jgi:addiction module HigA family antidote
MNIMPAIGIHPGEHLYEELQTLSLSAAEFARNLNVPTNRITQILNGQRAITGDTALRLAHFFGTTPEFWLTLQNLYELRLAGQKAGRAIQRLPRLKSAAPVYDLQKLVKAITPKNRHREVDFGHAQGREFPRGARRTR